jgi:hypothetical protein
MNQLDSAANQPGIPVPRQTPLFHSLENRYTRQELLRRLEEVTQRRLAHDAAPDELLDTLV